VVRETKHVVLRLNITVLVCLDFFPSFATVRMPSWPLVLLLCAVAQRVSGGMVAVDEESDLLVTPAAGRSVLVQGMDVPAVLKAVDSRLGALEQLLGILVGPVAPAGPSATSPVPRVGLDALGNLHLIPASSKKKIEKTRNGVGAG
jgi:hypothetical protein